MSIERRVGLLGVAAKVIEDAARDLNEIPESPEKQKLVEQWSQAKGQILQSMAREMVRLAGFDQEVTSHAVEVNAHQEGPKLVIDVVCASRELADRVWVETQAVFEENPRVVFQTHLRAA